MDIPTVYEWIERRKVIAVMRGAFSLDVARQVTRVLREEGITTFEFTANSTQPIETMQAIKHELGADACVGMGTVLDVGMAHRAVEAGADFVVSPVFQPEVVRVVQEAGVFMAPGVITPTEAVQAWAMGVPLLKIFPIGALGIDYFKTMFAPLDHLKFMCNGAIHAENARDFLKAGAIAVGVGNWLTGDGTTSLDIIRKRAQILRGVVDEAKGRAPLRTV